MPSDAERGGETTQAMPRWHKAARWARTGLRLALIAGLLTGLYLGSDWVEGRLVARFTPLYEAYGPSVLYAVIGVYVLALALPFVPGIEISLALLMMFRAEGVAIVYASTLLALSVSYGMGRLVPPRLIVRLFGWLHAHRAQALVERLGPLGPEERLRMLVETAPARIIPFLLRHRYVAVAIAFNLPGNAFIGGGGGIGMVAGMSGLFRFPRYVLMVCIAISPIPLLILAQAHW
ncbi:MAG TPA: hypothetical protein VKB51_10510 [bacterium]|nr:hypothetical protein [bacterium]